MIMRVRHPHPGYATPPLEGIRNRKAANIKIPSWEGQGWVNYVIHHIFSE